MTADPLVTIVAVLAGAILGGAVFFVLGRWAERREAARQGRAAEQQAEQVLSQARRDADSAKHEALLQAKEEIMGLREQWEKDERHRREELDKHEQRLEERETLIDRKLNAMDERDAELQRREQSVSDRKKAVQQREQELDELVTEHRQRLEQVSGLSAEEAKEALKRELVVRAKSEAAASLRDIKEDAKRTGDREARKIIAMAMQRLAADQATETTVSAVALPNDDMKGRIIGREGRNIRAFETATGVDVIIDDTPDTVVVSCFDPIRREVARRRWWRGCAPSWSSSSSRPERRRSTSSACAGCTRSWSSSSAA
jgi:ribonuclease Y